MKPAVGDQPAYTLEGQRMLPPPGTGGFTKREAVFLEVYITLLASATGPVGDCAPDLDRHSPDQLALHAGEHTVRILAYMEKYQR